MRPMRTLLLGRPVASDNPRPYPNPWDTVLLMTATPRLTVTNCADCSHQHYLANSCANRFCICLHFARKVSAPPLQEENAHEAAYKFTRARQDEYLGKLRQGIGRTKAAHEIGIHRRTVDRERAKGNGYVQECDDAEAYALDSAQESVFTAIRGGDGNLGLKVLERRRPDVWGIKKDPLPGSSPATPLYIAPGQIDWDNLPEELADKLLAVHAEIVALQPASGGFVVEADEYKVRDDWEGTEDE